MSTNQTPDGRGDMQLGCEEKRSGAVAGGGGGGERGKKRSSGVWDYFYRIDGFAALVIWVADVVADVVEGRLKSIGFNGENAMCAMCACKYVDNPTFINTNKSSTK